MGQDHKSNEVVDIVVKAGMSLVCVALTTIGASTYSKVIESKVEIAKLQVMIDRMSESLRKDQNLIDYKVNSLELRVNELEELRKEK